MYPEDRVLVGVMPHPADLEIAREQHWYRIPVRRAPKGVHAEYVAFYFTKAFGEDLRWAIHFYARRTGHELVKRCDLLPEQPDHPRADDMYYKIQLGPLRRKEPPIVSLRWRRITFIHTTWDRFTAAGEVNDLFSTDDQFVDRVYHALKARGIQPDRQVTIRDRGQKVTVDMLILCQDGAVLVARGDDRPHGALNLDDDPAVALTQIEREIKKRGGPLQPDSDH